MRNPLQEQLLKAGLVKKGKLAEVVREQNRQRKGQGKAATPAAPDAVAGVDVDRLRAERAERDRVLAAERKAQAQARELQAQVRQIIGQNRIDGNGDSPYRFTDAGVILSLGVDARQRVQLAKGQLVIVRVEDGNALLPRAAADKVRERDASFIVVDHAHAAPTADDDMDEHYRQFEIPDDLVW